MPFLFTCQKEEIILPSYTLLSTICVTVSHNYLHTASLISRIPDKQKIKLTLILDHSLRRLGINTVELYFFSFRNLTRQLLKHTLRNLCLERNCKWSHSLWSLNMLPGQLEGNSPLFALRNESTAKQIQDNADLYDSQCCFLSFFVTEF